MSRLVFCRSLAICVCVMLTSPSFSVAACTGTMVPTALLGNVSHSFSGVAMNSPTDIWAVGSTTASIFGPGATLAEHWDGTRWTVVPTPNAGQQTSQQLSGVAAVSSTDVWAVGQVSGLVGPGPSALILHWDGATWSPITSPSIGSGSSLNAVSAVSSTDVWAAGYYFDSTGTHALTEFWNGSAWSVVPDSDNVALTSISATSPTDAWATGNDIEHWNGATWQVVSTLQARSISAVTSNDVWALVAGSQPIERWNGASWSVVPSPSGGILKSITARSSYNAWAVGVNNVNGQFALSEHWNGSTWTVIKSPPSSSPASLNAVAFRGSSAVAVGFETRGSRGEIEGLNEQWNGSRWMKGADAYIDSNENLFSAVYASAPSDAWAAGDVSAGNSVFGYGLVERWDGSQWSPVPVTPILNNLNDIKGRSSTDIWAVGGGGDDCTSAGQAAVIHWNGSQWNYLSPNVCAGAGSNLVSVAEFSPSDVWAVGVDDEPGRVGYFVQHDLVLHRTGKTWTIYGMPQDPYTGGLTAIAGAYPDDMWAVGNTVVGRSSSYSLIFHWNGKIWTATRVTNPQRFALLNALGVVSGHDVWAVGGQSPPRRPPQPLIMHWNGLQWSAVAHAPGATGATLSAVIPISANDVWAVGSSPGGPHIEHWDGHTWSIVPTALSGSLAGLTAIPGMKSVWAVGKYPTQPMNPVSTQSLAATLGCSGPP
jgi:hypothetical protein